VSQATRAIPWDCSDWQAFAHADRDTVILESLAENRGKTLYCGIDQSDTFAKAETWAAGKDRNERDDTIYYGERGQFRGFIAAQEGWLTEGESGITGISRDRIFEFPREERRRKKTVRRRIPAAADRVVNSPLGSTVSSYTGTQANAEAAARVRFNNNPPVTAAGWQQLAHTAALAHCRSLGYTRAVKVATIVPDPIVWGYTPNRDDDPGEWTFEAYQIRQWTATCQKTVRRARR